MDGRKSTSISVEPDLWREFKIRCAERGKMISDVVEGLLRGHLKRTEPKANNLKTAGNARKGG